MYHCDKNNSNPEIAKFPENFQKVLTWPKEKISIGKKRKSKFGENSTSILSSTQWIEKQKKKENEEAKKLEETALKKKNKTEKKEKIDKEREEKKIKKNKTKI